MRLLGGLVAVSMLFAGCAQGVDDETFVSSVTNQQLESPAAADLAISFVTDASGVERIKVNWPTILGASAYLCNVWNVNDPENPILLVENEEVDGTSFTFSLLDDTNFRISVLTLGNKKYNNKDAVSATSIEYFVGVQGVTIPSGSDIGDFIAADIARNAEAWAAARANDVNFEVAYDLEQGGQYTMNTQIDFGLQPARIRCLAESNRPQVVMGEGVNGIYTAAGLRCVNINFDCTSLPVQKGQGVVTLSPVQYPELILVSQKGGNDKMYELKKPVRFENCNFKNVPVCFFSTGRNAWAMRQLDITNCIIQLNHNSSGDGSDIISAYDSKGTYVGESQIWRGAIQKIAIRNSTIYNLGDCGGRFLRFASKDMNRHFETNSGEFLMENCTVIHPCVKQNQFANNTPNNKDYKIVFNNNVLYDVCYINKLIQGSCTKDIDKKRNTIKTITQKDTEDSGDLNYCTAEDPQFAAPMSELDLTDSQYGGQNFKASGAISSTIGDPRWL